MMPEAPDARSRSTVIVAPALFGRRIEVTVNPPMTFFPLRSFQTYRDAVSFARELGRQHGWAIHDQCDAEAG